MTKGEPPQGEPNEFGSETVDQKRSRYFTASLTLTTILAELRQPLFEAIKLSVTGQKMMSEEDKSKLHTLLEQNSRLQQAFDTYGDAFDDYKWHGGKIEDLETKKTT